MLKELARKDLTGVEACIGDDVDEDDAGFILLLEGDSSTVLVPSLRMSDIICR